MFYVMLMITTKISSEYTQQGMRGNKNVSLTKNQLNTKEGNSGENERQSPCKTYRKRIKCQK